MGHGTSYASPMIWSKQGREPVLQPREKGLPVKLFSFVALAATMLGVGAVRSAAASPRLPALHPSAWQARSLARYGLGFHLMQTGGTPTATPGTATAVTSSTATPTTGTATPTTGTATPTTGTATPTTSPTPTSTATPSPYPDPVVILQNAFNTIDQLQNVAFVDRAVQTQGNDKLVIHAKARATCKNYAIQGHITASNQLAGTAQARKVALYVINIKNGWWVKSKATKGRWKKSTEKGAEAFGFSISNPLTCPNTAPPPSSGSGSSSSQQGGPIIKDLTNLGPATFQKTKMWKIHASGVYQDPSSGQTLPLTYDFLISQSHDVMYRRTLKITDTSSQFVLTFQETYSRFGKKVVVKAPKIGSTKP